MMIKRERTVTSDGSYRWAKVVLTGSGLEVIEVERVDRHYPPLNGGRVTPEVIAFGTAKALRVAERRARLIVAEVTA